MFGRSTAIQNKLKGFCPNHPIVGIYIVLLLILLGCQQVVVDAYYTRYSLKYYYSNPWRQQQHLGKVPLRPHGARRGDKQSNNDELGDGTTTTTSFPPGYKFFQGDGSYVPYGMTRDEYQQLRKREVDRERRMNYGAWGPRFKRTGVPMGDWMVMPNLWTLGQVSRSPAVGGIMDVNGERRRKQNGNSTLQPFIGGIVQLIRTYIHSFVVGYFILSCLEASIWMLRWKVYEMSPVVAVTTLMKMLILRKGVVATTLATVESTKVLLAALLTPAINTILERTNRRLLWSKGRITLAATSCALCGVIGWGVLLKVLRL